jgi:hypothetical protein
VKPQETAARHDAVVRIVDRVVDAASATFVVRLDLPNPVGAIARGVRCQADIDIALPKAGTAEARSPSQP